jgi:hypothetical protein
MRLQIIALALVISSGVFASAETEIKALFKKYYQVMDQHKVELVDDVFSKKFLTDNGGKEEFIKGVKEIPKSSAKTLPSVDVSFKKGVVDEMYFVKPKQGTLDKSKSSSGPEFIVIKEDGKLKIQGTASDGE